MTLPICPDDINDETIAGAFHRRGYCLIPNALEINLASSICAHIQQLAANGLTRSDNLVPGTPASYGNPLIETVLRKLVPSIEEWCGCRVFPTYSYFRIYKHGDVLNRHRDRPSCEISLSVSVGFSGGQPWPLFIEGEGGAFAAAMRVGDGLLYKGGLPHWREPFTGSMAAQVFFHYVDQNGPNSEWRNDKRTDPRF